MNSNTDVFWAQQVKVLWQPDQLLRFMPTQSMSLAEKLNAIVRLTVYLTLALSVCRFSTGKSHLRGLWLAPALALLLTYAYYKYSQKDSVETFKDQLRETRQSLSKLVCKPPTLQNPFMNLSPYNYNKPSPPPACQYVTDRKMEKKVKDSFKETMFHDVSDVYAKRHSQRQYYTAPVTTVPNNQTKFANWLYKVPPTCKVPAGRLSCIANVNSPFLADTPFKWRYH